MRITWVTRSFLDYRIPIYKEINRLCKDNLTVIYNSEVVPERCQEKLKDLLADRSIGLKGEIRIGGKKIENQTFANRGGIRIPLRPGLYKILKKSKPDIVLSDGFFQWTYSALLLNIFHKVPHLMCYERTAFTERNVTFLRRNARKIASRFISGICCNGIETKSYLEDFGFPSDRLFLGNMAADTSGLRQDLVKVTDNQINILKRKNNISGKVFLYVGQLIPRKGILELLNSWKAFDNQKNDVTLLLLGDGEQMDEAKEFVKNNKLDSVRLLGRVDYSLVSQFYALSDVFLIPTLEDNWSLVVPEAMSCHLPIICSKYNGCWPELVRKENGWVFDPLNEEDFLKTIETVLAEEDRWKQMGKESAKMVEEFSPIKIASQIFKSINKLIK